jgi:hypothetical protein
VKLDGYESVEEMEARVERAEDWTPIERAYAEAMHEDCPDPPAGHPVDDHSPWSGGDLDGTPTWAEFMAQLARHGLTLVLNDAPLGAYEMGYAGWNKEDATALVDELLATPAPTGHLVECRQCSYEGRLAHPAAAPAPAGLDETPTGRWFRETYGPRPSPLLPGLDAAIDIVQQSLDTVRGEDDGESRSIKASIAAREHIIALLTGYRDGKAALQPASLTGEEPK